MIIDGATNNTTSIFRDKCNLGCKNIVKSALRWYNVKNGALHLHHQYDFEGVRDICIYKGNKNFILYLNLKPEYIKKIKIHINLFLIIFIFCYNAF